MGTELVSGDRSVLLGLFLNKEFVERVFPNLNTAIPRIKPGKGKGHTCVRQRFECFVSETYQETIKRIRRRRKNENYIFDLTGRYLGGIMTP